MKSYPKIKNAKAIQELILEVEFDNGIIKFYDFANFINKYKTYDLSEFNFFKTFTIDSAGYGIIWNDEIDIAEAELWTNGTTNLPLLV